MRRMIATDCWQVHDYLAYLNQHPTEIQSLANKLLNGFTAFFRDGAAFEFLANAVFPVLFKNKQENAAIRVWVPGCATGEEAYSLAILFQEHLAKFEQYTSTKIEILATDINLQAIRVARRGLYPRTITAHLSDHYLNHYFDEVEAGYQVKPHLRDMICFVSRSLVRSPATYGVNLISCRNLLIYFKPEFQQMALTCFYEHLEEKGFLFLGGSESVGTASDLFSVIDAKWCVFQRKEGLLPLPSFPICSLSVNE
jgi:two-component system CheB/CheR fusion protein